MVVIIKSGEFEVLKRRTSNVYLNKESGIVQVNYGVNKQIKSKRFLLSEPIKEK